ncbi:bifunctional 3'-5' exonuclease/DNA polymerase [Leptolyngbya sp. AN02str]|jgi:DNA polymerase-1|uniref:bifunctional 3'-5' exonuclease/DNA polymerase n=1 Tax=Leptolyngbya sp. AN02str TaxID=3423363 RepID=UPI003D31706C
MTVKISSPNVSGVEANSNLPTAADPLYEDLMDWAKSRKRQFLRNRVQQSSEPIKAATAESETPSASDAWIETWYTPPPLPSRIAKQKATFFQSHSVNASSAPYQEAGGGVEAEEVKEIKPLLSPSPATSLSPPNHDSFEIGQQVVLRPDSQRVPAGIPIDAVLIIQEMYVNVYRQHENTWCVWCSSDAFSGLKSIDSDCLMPLPKPVHKADIESVFKTEFNGLNIDEKPNSVLSHTPVNFEFVEDGQRLAEVLKPFQTCQVIAVDTETTGLDPLKDRIRLVQIAAANQPIIIIDLFKVAKETLTPLCDLLQGTPIKVLQNAKFDLKFLQQAGLPIAGKLFDTMIAAQLLDAGVRSHGYNLAELVKVYLGEELSKEQQRSDWSNPSLFSEQLEYAARDAAILLRLREVMKPKLTGARLVETAKLEFDCLGAIAQMELNGMLLDLSRWDALRQELEQRRDQLADALRHQFQPALLSTQLDILGNQTSFNLDSQQQVLEALQQMGVPVENTSKLSLIPLAEEYPPVRALLDYRKAAKSVQAFASSLPKHVHPITGRIHPDYQQMGAATGRMSCRNPNLQQIPRDKIFRSCFIPAPGYRLVVADYSQIELRVAAELSGDRRMIEAYQNDEDLHRLTAALIADKSLDQVEKSERQAAKAVNFGLIYAMGAKGLAEYAYNNYGVQMSLKQAETFRKRYFEAYQGIARWHGAIKRRLPREMRTVGDRLRCWKDEPKLTELLNTPVQGTAADITKAALAKLPMALKGTGARLIGTVHDEILLEAPEDAAEQAAQILQQVMEQAGQRYLRKVPVKAEVAIALNWAEK